MLSILLSSIITIITTMISILLPIIITIITTTISIPIIIITTIFNYLSIFTLTITILTLTLFLIFLTSPPSQGNLTIAEALLEGGADPNLCDEAQGKTPLHHAAYWGHLAVLQLLLDKGALVNSKVGALVGWGGGKRRGLDREWVGLGGVARGVEGL